MAGGAPATMAEVIDILSDVIGKPLAVEAHAERPGDVGRTGGSCLRAAELLR